MLAQNVMVCADGTSTKRPKQRARVGEREREAQRERERDRHTHTHTHTHTRQAKPSHVSPKSCVVNASLTAAMPTCERRPQSWTGFIASVSVTACPGFAKVEANGRRGCGERRGKACHETVGLRTRTQRHAHARVCNSRRDSHLLLCANTKHCPSARKTP